MERLLGGSFEPPMGRPPHPPPHTHTLPTPLSSLPQCSNGFASLIEISIALIMSPLSITSTSDIRNFFLSLYFRTIFFKFLVNYKIFPKGFLLRIKQSKQSQHFFHNPCCHCCCFLWTLQLLQILRANMLQNWSLEALSLQAEKKCVGLTEIPLYVLEQYWPFFQSCMMSLSVRKSMLSR